MRPSTAISADGPINLYNAVILAGSDEAVGKGVLVALNDQINAAREVTKTNTSTQTPSAHRNSAFSVICRETNRTSIVNRRRRHTVDSSLTFRVSMSYRKSILSTATQHEPGRDRRFCRSRAKGIVHAGVGDGSLGSARG